MEKKLKIGLIVPPSDNEVPPEAEMLYGDEIDFIAYGLNIEKMCEAEFSCAMERIDEAAEELFQYGVDAISVMGTSLTFFMGVIEVNRLFNSCATRHLRLQLQHCLHQ